MTQLSNINPQQKKRNSYQATQHFRDATVGVFVVFVAVFIIVVFIVVAVVGI